MKVLSIKEPWASLIINGHKKYEFRSWKTNFRGKIWIHASQTIDNNSVSRFEALNMKYFKSSMIGSAEIVDCIKVDSEFEETLREENELVYGATIGRGGYAFQLENVQKWDMPILAKGQLGIWDYYDEKEIMQLMNPIEYGWIDKNGKPNVMINDMYDKEYVLQSPKQVKENKIGVCWDQVELERYYFKSHPDVHTYFLCYYAKKQCPSHTFLTFKKGGKCYWFEHAWKAYRGIHMYDTQEELLKDVVNKFTQDLEGNIDREQLILREYTKPSAKMSVKEFYEHCEKGTIIEYDSIKNWRDTDELYNET